MARKKAGVFVDLIEIAAMLPWWGGVLLALISYFVLHQFSVGDSVAVVNASQIGSTMTSIVMRVLASVGQYLLPALFLIGSVISAFNASKRSRLFSKINDVSSDFRVYEPIPNKREALIADVKAAPSVLSKLSDITWREFEMLVGESFKRKGFDVRETGGYADGGVDIVLKKDGEKYLVQCKQWKAFKVDVMTVRELYGVMAAEGASGGYVVTSGRFTTPAKDFAKGRNIFLVDGHGLVELIGDAEIGKVIQNVHSSNTAPNCPACGIPMTRRLSRQASHHAKPFWGCSNFPKCRAIISID